MANKIITQQDLKQKYTYDPLTGHFKNISDGKIAGHNHVGYVILVIGKNTRYRAHRMAWLYMTGEMPKNHIDHKNLVRSDNRWENIRECTSSQNAMNRPVQSNNKLGIKGVRFRPDRNKYVATAKINKKQIHLGEYDTAEEAKLAYNKYTKIHYGEFFRD